MLYGPANNIYLYSTEFFVFQHYTITLFLMVWENLICYHFLLKATTKYIHKPYTSLDLSANV